MKIVVSKSTFLEKLTPAMGTISTKNTIPSIEGILLETLEGGQIRLSSYDMNKGMRTVFEAEEVVREGSCIINAQRLLQIVRLMPGDSVTVETDENGSATISSGRSTFSLSALRGEEFPNLPELTGEKGFTLPANVLRDMIGKVQHSVAELDTRPMLCGAYFKLKGDLLEVVSCDSYTLSICSRRCKVSDIGSVAVTELSFLLPGHALSELVRLLPDKEEEVRIYIARKHAIVHVREFTFFTRMIDSEYIDYERIIPKNQTITVSVSRTRLLDGLERANLVADEKIQGSGRSYVKLQIEGDHLTLTSTSANGRVVDEMECSHTGDDLTIGFNCRYLINSVRAADSDGLLISLKSPTQSVTMVSTEEKEDSRFFYMVLPVRMND